LEDKKAFDARQFRTTLGRFASGVTIVTTSVEGATHGMTANAFVSVSLEPPLVLVSVDNRAHMARLLLVGRSYGVSVLAEDQVKLSDHFAGRKVGDIEVPFITKNNTPLIDGAVAHLGTNIVKVVPAGDHNLVIGQVEYLDWQEGRNPLLFYSGRYRHLAEEKLETPEWPEDEFSMFSIGNY